MGSPACYGSIQVCAIRAALLDDAGVPVEGAANGYVSEAPITVNIGIELEDGADVVRKNGCGQVCQNYQGPSQFKRANLGLALCELDIQLAQLIAGGTLIPFSNGDPFGWEFPGASDEQPYVSLEFWTKAWDGSAQATPASTGNAAAYWHWVFSKVQWALDDMTVEDETFLEFAFTGVGTENPNLPAHGPFNDWPADLAAAGGFSTAGGIFLDTAGPEQTCDFIEVPTVVS